MNKHLLTSYGFVSILFCTFLLLPKTSLAYSRYYVSNGSIYVVGDVLGDDDVSDNDGDKDESESEDAEKKEEKRGEDLKKSEEHKKEEIKSQEERIRMEVKRKSTQKNEQENESDDENEIENEDSDDFFDSLELPEGADFSFDMDRSIAELAQKEKIGRTEFKMKENGKVELKVKLKQTESQTEDENETEDEDLFNEDIDVNDMEDILTVMPEDSTKSEVKIKAKNGRLKIEAKGVSADTKFPLSVDPTTNTLTIETPSGKINIVVLPDKAIQNLLENKKIGIVFSTEITTDKDKVVYKVKGQKAVKLFGYLPLVADVEMNVDTQNGEIVDENVPWYLKYTEFLFTK